MKKQQREALDLETLLTHRELFGLTTATNVQRAVCRVLDGKPLGELWDDPEVRAVLGGVRPPEVMPLELILLAGIRAAKSLLSAACAFRAVQTCDLSSLRPGEIARVPVVSVDKDKAGIIFDHLKGTLLAKSALRSFLVGEEQESLLIRQGSTGRIVEVVITAGKRAGSSLVGRWLAGAVFDEAPRLLGSDDGVVNLEDSRRAILGRMLPGAQILYPGSPFAPEGPIYEWVQEFFGHPTRELVVMKGPGRAFNPVYWTPEKETQLKKQDPIAYRTDALGEFADGETQVFLQEELDAVERATDAPVPFIKNHFYVATMDPATRSNAWTLTVWTCDGMGPSMEPMYSVVLAKQWVPKGTPLSPRAVFTEMADDLFEYGLVGVTTDQWSVDSLSDVAAHLPSRPDGSPRKLELFEETATQQTRYDGIKTLHVLVQEHRVSLPRNPMLRQDLMGVKRRVTQGGIIYALPRTRDGRHADYVPPLALGATNPPRLPAPPEPARDRDLLAALARLNAPADPMLGAIGRMTGTRLG